MDANPELDPARQPCPKCRGERVEGCVVDLGDGTMRRVSTWQPGTPTTKDATLFFGHGHYKQVVAPPPKPSIPITAWRCTRCGHLEFYARPLGAEPEATEEKAGR